MGSKAEADGAAFRPDGARIPGDDRTGALSEAASVAYPSPQGPAGGGGRMRIVLALEGLEDAGRAT